MRFSAALVLCSLFNWAPLQCQSDPDPALRRAETPGEALYGLAKQFRAKGDEEAWKATLQYLVARYPNSRFSVRAKAELAAATSAR